MADVHNARQKQEMRTELCMAEIQGKRPRKIKH